MQTLSRVLGFLCLFLAVGALAAAQGMVQLRFSGALGTDKSHLVEVEIVEAESGNELVLHVHLAAGTTGAELAELVARRAERAGISLTAPAPVEERNLFVDAASEVRMRLGGGLSERSPAWRARRPSSASCGPARSPGRAPSGSWATARSSRRGRPPVRARAHLFAEVTPEMDAPATATALWRAGAERWMSERPGSDGWRPIRLLEGGVLTGVSVRVDGHADWRLEVSLD